MKQLILILMLIFLAGCSSKPAQFYIMNSMHASGKNVRGIKVVVGPVNIAPYLQRSQIITRVTQQHLHFAEYHRWAEPLRDNVSTILIENLKAILHTKYVFPYPVTSSSSGIRVSVDILRFDTSIDGLCILKANWRLISNKTGGLIRARSIYLTTRVIPAKPMRYNSIVVAMNRNLQKLSYAISKSIRYVL